MGKSSLSLLCFHYRTPCLQIRLSKQQTLKKAKRLRKRIIRRGAPLVNPRDFSPKTLTKRPPCATMRKRQRRKNSRQQSAAERSRMVQGFDRKVWNQPGSSKMKKFVYCEGMMVTDAKRNLTGSLRYQRHVSKKLMMRAGFS